MRPEIGWGAYIITYFFLGGVAAGAYFTAALAEIFGDRSDREMAKVGYYIAFPLVLICGALLIVDLGQPMRFWELLVQPSDASPAGWAPTFKLESPIQLGSFALLGFGFFSFLSLLDVWVEEGRVKFAPLRRFYTTVPRKLYAAVGVLFGWFLAGYTGVLVNTTAQPLWAATNWVGPLFLASAVSTGAAAISFIMAIRNRKQDAESEERLTRLDNTAILIEVAILLVVLATATGMTSAILSGTFSLVFWSFVAAGIVVPLVLQGPVSLGGGRLPRNLTALAAVLILVGGFLMRYLIVMVGQT